MSFLDPIFALPDQSQIPSSWRPTDHGLISWSYDPINAINASTPTAGQLYLVRLHVPLDTTVTNVVLAIGTAGSGLTSGQNFAALYNSARGLLAVTSDQTTSWASAGTKVMSLSTPQAVTAGDYYAGFWSQGTTLPQFLRGATYAVINVGRTTSVARYSASNTGVTTTAPNPAGGGASSSTAWWAAVS